MRSHHGVPRDRDRDKPQPKVPQRAEARLKSAPLFVSSNMLQSTTSPITAVGAEIPRDNSLANSVSLSRRRSSKSRRRSSESRERSRVASEVPADKVLHGERPAAKITRPSTGAVVGDTRSWKSSNTTTTNLAQSTRTRKPSVVAASSASRHTGMTSALKRSTSSATLWPAIGTSTTEHEQKNTWDRKASTTGTRKTDGTSAGTDAKPLKNARSAASLAKEHHSPTLVTTSYMPMSNTGSTITTSALSNPLSSRTPIAAQKETQPAQEPAHSDVSIDDENKRSRRQKKSESARWSTAAVLGVHDPEQYEALLHPYTGPSSYERSRLSQDSDDPPASVKDVPADSVQPVRPRDSSAHSLYYSNKPLPPVDVNKHDTVMTSMTEFLNCYVDSDQDQVPPLPSRVAELQKNDTVTASQSPPRSRKLPSLELPAVPHAVVVDTSDQATPHAHHLHHGIEQPAAPISVDYEGSSAFSPVATPSASTVHHPSGISSITAMLRLVNSRTPQLPSIHSDVSSNILEDVGPHSTPSPLRGTGNLPVSDYVQPDVPRTPNTPAFFSSFEGPGHFKSGSQSSSAASDQLSMSGYITELRQFGREVLSVVEPGDLPIDAVVAPPRRPSPSIRVAPSCSSFGLATPRLFEDSGLNSEAGTSPTSSLTSKPSPPLPLGVVRSPMETASVYSSASTIRPCSAPAFHAPTSPSSSPTRAATSPTPPTPPTLADTQIGDKRQSQQSIASAHLAAQAVWSETSWMERIVLNDDTRHCIDDEAGQIVQATFFELFRELLLYPGARFEDDAPQAEDEPLRRAFWTVLRHHAAAADVLAAVHAVYRVQIRDGRAELLRSAEFLVDQVCSEWLGFWQKATDEALAPAFEEFIRADVAPESPEHATRLLAALRTRNREGVFGRPLVTDLAPRYKYLPPALELELPKQLDLVAFAAGDMLDEFTRQLTCALHHAYKRMPPPMMWLLEWHLTCGGAGPEQEFLGLCGDLRSWVAKSIADARNTDTRIATVIFWMNVAQRCFDRWNMAAAVTISEALEDEPCKLLWDDPKLEGRFVLGRSLLPFAKNKGTPAPAYLAHLQHREDGGVDAHYVAHISKYDTEGAYPFVPHLPIHRALAGQHTAAGATTLGWTSDGQLLMNVRTLRDLCSAVIPLEQGYRVWDYSGHFVVGQWVKTQLVAHRGEPPLPTPKTDVRLPHELLQAHLPANL